MGLLNQLGGMLSGNNSTIDYTALLQWIEQQGGIHGVLEKFRQGGLSEIVQSWIGADENQPISGQQVQNVMGSEALQQLAAKLGLNSEKAANIIAQFLPQLVNKLSANGEMPQNPDLMSVGLSLLKNKFFN